MNAFYFLTWKSMHGPYCFAVAKGIAKEIRRDWYGLMPVLIIDATALFTPEQLKRIARCEAPGEPGEQGARA